MKALFRVDASAVIGSGHVARCLNLAKALSKHGINSHFVTKSHVGNLSALIQQSGFRTSELAIETDDVSSGSSYASWVGGSWEADARETLHVIGDDVYDWIVVDHYGLDSRWEHALRPAGSRILAIDDLANRDHDCDLLLDQNLFRDMVTRYNVRLSSQCGRMLGPTYALLQPEYAALHNRAPPREGSVKTILVYFGGADHRNITGMVVEILADLNSESLNVDVVVNANNPFASQIRSATKNNPRFVVHDQKKTLAELMVRADLCIGAAGVTSWERCCLGLPTLLITLAENQRAVAAELDRLKLAIHIGDAASYDLGDLRSRITTTLSHQLTSDWSERCAKAVDGRGAERVAGLLAVSRTTCLTSRFATVADENLVLDWSNDPEARRNAFSSEPISAETHRKWYRTKLRAIHHCVFLIIEAFGFLPIGQVRFDRREQGWEISYMLDPRIRGRGLGAPLLAAALEHFSRIWPGVSAFGKVKRGNQPSCRVFEQLSFVCEESPDVFTYSRNSATAE